MMNGPFFRNYSNQQPLRSARSVPVQRTQQRSLPKVVSVPVHFVSSEQPRTTLSMLKESAALKIQKVFRGFLVRKSVKKVASVRNEVSEIERRINDIEVVDRIRRDAKERLRVNETLMSLLFKLDSIRGVDCGVRVLRKEVTRKAIALQEKVDSIAQADQQTLEPSNSDSGEIDRRSASEKVTETSNDPSNFQVVEDDHQTLNSSNNDIGEIDNKGATEQVIDTSDGPCNLQAVEDDADDGVIKEMIESCDPVNAIETDPVNATETCDVEEGMETSLTGNLTKIGKEDQTSMAGSVEMQKDKEEDEDNEHKANRELLKKLMADNDKMMKLMMQISERNEMQTRMINLLSQRVEQLEKAFMTDKLRRKKKTHVASKKEGQR